MSRFCLLIIAVIVVASLPAVAADDQPRLQEEVWALPLPWPTIAYVVRPVGNGPFPLAIMNHGVSLDPVQRSFFPLVEFRDAAMWFARRGYMVVAPAGSGYGAAAVEVAEDWTVQRRFLFQGREVQQSQFPSMPASPSPNSISGSSNTPTSSGASCPTTSSSSANPPAAGRRLRCRASIRPPVKAIITFAAGRGGRVDGKPNNNCAPDKLVEAAGEFGRSSRVPMLWMYIENDTYFSPELGKRMHAAFTAAGGKAEFHVFPPHGSDGHFFVGAADAVPIWSPVVAVFLDKHK